MLTLIIDTTDQESLSVGLERDGAMLSSATVPAARRQAEELLPAIGRLLLAAGLTLSDLEEIKVANFGGSFTALRIGVVTANALGFALGIRVVGTHGPAEGSGQAVEPHYQSEPQITAKKKLL